MHLSNVSAFLPAIIWAVVILVLSTMPGISLPEGLLDLLAPDKWAHAIVYGIFTVLIIKGFQKKSTNKILIAVFLAGFYGILMEIIQYSFFPNRYFEILDIIANIIGIIGSLFLLRFFIK